MKEAGEEAPGLQDAWKSTERSVREYYDLINRALNHRIKKGAGIEQSSLLCILQRSPSH